MKIRSQRFVLGSIAMLVGIGLAQPLFGQITPKEAAAVVHLPDGLLGFLQPALLLG